MDRQHDYLRIGEAAAYLGVAAGTLRNWERSGKIRTFRHPLNNYRLFRRRDLDEILQRIEQSGRAPTYESSAPEDYERSAKGGNA
jgi:MerR family transcriptional regulator, copper efflux regulator